MTTQQKFTAAVNVIRNLPKNGPFQPSTDMKLKFYAYFKQATEGPIAIPKPSIWDIQGRVKWGAWKELGSMSQDDAMEKYIEELKSIVETMSYNANVETFLSSLGAFYDCVPAADVDLVLGPVIEKVKSRVHSPIASRDPSPGRQSADDSNKVENINKSENGKYPVVETRPPSESDDDEFSDVIESLEIADRMERGARTELSLGSSSSEASYPLDSPKSQISANQSLSFTVTRLQSDLIRITERVASLETTFVANSIRQMNERNAARERRKFLEIPLTAWGILMLWPVCANMLLCFVLGHNKRN